MALLLCLCCGAVANAPEETGQPAVLFLRTETPFVALPEEQFGGAHPTEETGFGDSSQLLIPPAAPMLFQYGEEFAGGMVFEDAQTPPLPLLAAVQLTSVEEIIVTVVVSATPDEYGQPQMPLPPPLAPSTALSVEEQFAGSMVFEDSQPPWLPEQPRWMTWQTEEEFGLPHPTEETSTLIYLVALPPIALINIEEVIETLTVEEHGIWVTAPPLPPATAPSIPEDFAGILTVDEYGQPVIVWPLPPAVTASSEEEFGLPHPIEELSPLLPIFVLPPVWLTNIEEIITILTVEEHGIPVPPPLLPPWVAPSIPEDFAGILTIDEYGTPVVVWPLPPAVAASVEEEFGLPHPIEETSPPIYLVPLPPVWLSNIEEVITILTVDEYGIWATVPPLPPATTPSIPEDFAGVITVDEYGSPVIVPALPPVWLASVEEEFGAAHPIEEWSPWPWLPPLPPIYLDSREEEFGLSHPIDEWPIVLPLPPLAAWLAPSIEEEFSGAVVVEEWPQQLFIPLAAALYVSPPEEDFSGAIVIEENSPLLFLFYVPAPPLFVDAEILPRRIIPPPPPPPPPPAPIVPTGGAGGRGSSGFSWAKIEICPPVCPPDKRLFFDEEKREWICVDAEQIDYALLALNVAEIQALADGCVDVFRDIKGIYITRLVADDGTTFYYANLNLVKTGRVKRGDVIGVSEGMAGPQPSALGAPKKPKLLGAAAIDAPVDAPPPAPAFTVMPIIRQRAPQPAPAPAPLVFTPPPAPEPLALPPSPSGPLTVPEKIVLGIGAVAIVYVIYRWIAAPPAKRKPPKKRKRRAKRR